MFKRRLKNRNRSVGSNNSSTSGASFRHRHGCGSSDGESSTICSSACPLRSCLKIDETASNGTPHRKQTVRFQEVQIREFERIIGDNPSCSSGAPIGIGWRYSDAKSVSVDEHEKRKTYQKRSKDLVLSRQEREELLVEWGANFHEIIEAIRANVKAKNQRRRTVNAIGTYDRWEEVMENASRKIKRTLTLKKGKKMIRWEQQQQYKQNVHHRNDQVAPVPELKPNDSLEEEHKSIRNEESKENMSSEQTNQATSVTNNRNEKDDLSLGLSSAGVPPGKHVVVDLDTGSVNFHDHVSEYGTLDDDEDNTSFPSQYYEDDNRNVVVVEMDIDFEDDYDDPLLTPSVAREMKIAELARSSPYDQLRQAMALQEQQLHYYHKIPMMGNQHHMGDQEAPIFYVYGNTSSGSNISDFTIPNSGTSRGSAVDGNFEKLERDMSFWELRPGEHDAPQIQRKVTPVIISENEQDDYKKYGYSCDYGPPSLPDKSKALNNCPERDSPPVVPIPQQQRPRTMSNPIVDTDYNIGPDPFILDDQGDEFLNLISNEPLTRTMSLPIEETARSMTVTDTNYRYPGQNVFLEENGLQSSRLTTQMPPRLIGQQEVTYDIVLDSPYGFSDMNYYSQDATSYNVVDGKYNGGFSMPTPPNSSALISKWE